MVTLPSEVVSGFSVSPVSGDALTASPPAVMLSVPPVMFSSSSQDRPSSAALMFSLTSATVITASAAPLMPFFALPSTVSVPVPPMASAAPLLTLTAAFSSLEPAVSATVLVVPAAAIRGRLGGLVQGDRRAVVIGERQTVQHNGNARDALFDRDRAVIAVAGEHIGARRRDGNVGAVNLIAGVLCPLRSRTSRLR